MGYLTEDTDRFGHKTWTLGLVADRETILEVNDLLTSMDGITVYYNSKSRSGGVEYYLSATTYEKDIATWLKLSYHDR